MSTVLRAGLLPATSKAITLGVLVPTQYQSTVEVPSQRGFAWVGLPFALALAGLLKQLPHHRRWRGPRAAAPPRLPCQYGRVAYAKGEGMRSGSFKVGVGGEVAARTGASSTSSMYNILILPNRVFGFLGYKHVGA